MAQSDHQALGVIQELLRRGRRVPDDVRVSGVDDSPLCEVSPVPPSSVSQRMQDTGRAAVELLLRQIEGNTVQSLIIPPRGANRRGPDGRVFPRSPFQWGLFVSTKADLLDPAETQPINRHLNLHLGFNLNKVHRWTRTFRVGDRRVKAGE